MRLKAERYFAPFYIRRAHRILPLYGRGFGVCILGDVFVPLSRNIRDSGRSIVFLCRTIPLSCRTFGWPRHGGSARYTLGVTWSLAVEEQFYLTLPLIIRYVSRPRLWWIVGGMIAGAPLLRMLLDHSVSNGVYRWLCLDAMPRRCSGLGHCRRADNENFGCVGINSPAPSLSVRRLRRGRRRRGGIAFERVRVFH